MAADPVVADPALAEWLTRRAQALGRPLRVLHVGNVANNAYLNAKFLRRAGIECHVLSYDYYDPMATPEWEEEPTGWLRRRPRPRWFVQGPFPLCASYLDALNRGARVRAWLHWQRLRLYRPPRPQPANVRGAARPTSFGYRKGAARRLVLRLELMRWHASIAAWRTFMRARTHLHLRLLVLSARLRYLRSYVWSFTAWLVRRLLRTLRLNVPEPPLADAAPALVDPLPGELAAVSSAAREAEPARPPGWGDGAPVAALTAIAPGAAVTAVAPERADAPPAASVGGDAPLAAQLIECFRTCFPDRPDQLRSTDLEIWGSPDPWQRLFEPYDLVQCYSTDVVRALLAGKRPYVGFEHGTLRVFTTGDVPLHRLTALAYRESDHVLITNGDCLDYARRLGIECFTPMVHLVDVEQHERDDPRGRARIRQSFGGDVLLLCPLRHDWEIKGTDVHIRALPRIVEETRGRVVLALTEWGADVEASCQLLEELGCDAYVRWLPPLDRPTLVRHLKASDVVLDQIALPHFGATAPQALAAGVPVVMSYHPESTDWIVPEPAPILAAFDPDGVAEAVRTALDPGWRADHARRARAWIRAYHAPRRVVTDHVRIYRDLLETR